MVTFSKLPLGAFLISMIVFHVIGKSEVKHSRRRRYLDLPKGSALAVSVAYSVFLPKGVVPAKIQNGYGHIIEYDFLYPFPDRLEFIKAQKMKKTQKIKKKKKNPPIIFHDPSHIPYHTNEYPFFETNERTGWGRSGKGKFLDQLTQFISRLGHNGNACVRRLACESKEHLYFGRSLINDIILLLMPNVSLESCKKSFTDCSFSPLHAIMHATPIG